LIASIAALCLVLGGCERHDEEPGSPQAQPAKKQTAAPPTVLQQALENFRELPLTHEPAQRARIVSEPISDRRDWIGKVLKQGYAATGHTNVSWDSAAHQALMAYADYTRVATDSDHYRALTNATVRALAQGCDDPMINYMVLRYGLSRSNHTQETYALAGLATFRSMISSQYHPILKFMVGLRAVEAAKQAEHNGDRSPVIAFVTAYAEDLARDTNAPATDVFDSAFLWIEHSSDHGWVVYVTSELEGIIKVTWGKDERFYRLHGLAEFERAWYARGNEFADKVTPQGWKDFEMHLKGAALALETAWQMNPTNAWTAYTMMRVELGQGQGRERMEKWFNRAMNLDPNYYEAADLMSYYLEPRWYGSEQTAIAFGRSCVSSTNWGGRVPLVLADLHRSLASYYKQTSGPDHWAQPGVWEDVRSSYEKFFQLNPGEYGYRHNYARDAYLCRHYQDFLVQAKLFPWTNYAFFGGEQKFRQMLEQAASGGSRR